MPTRGQAELLEPGQKVVIHKGVYRERVCPARGGSAPEAMIAYGAARGEEVVVKGSRTLEGPFEKSTARLPENAGRVWTARLPDA